MCIVKVPVSLSLHLKMAISPFGLIDRACHPPRLMQPCLYFAYGDCKARTGLRETCERAIGLVLVELD
jgi:hypothetical protein